MTTHSQVRLDTHVVAWLASGDVALLSKRATDLIESNDLVVSPAVTLELTFLHEIGRLSVGGPEIVAQLASQVGLEQSDVSFTDAVSSAVALGFTRDPFDRLISGDALAAGTPLLTRDREMLEHVALAVW